MAIRHSFLISLRTHLNGQTLRARPKQPVTYRDSPGAYLICLTRLPQAGRHFRHNQSFYANTVAATRSKTATAVSVERRFQMPDFKELGRENPKADSLRTSESRHWRCRSELVFCPPKRSSEKVQVRGPETPSNRIFLPFYVFHLMLAHKNHAANASSIPPNTRTLPKGGLSKASDSIRPVAAPINAKPIIA